MESDVSHRPESPITAILRVLLAEPEAVPTVVARELKSSGAHHTLILLVQHEVISSFKTKWKNSTCLQHSDHFMTLYCATEHVWQGSFPLTCA